MTCLPWEHPGGSSAGDREGPGAKRPYVMPSVFVYQTRDARPVPLRGAVVHVGRLSEPGPVSWHVHVHATKPKR